MVKVQTRIKNRISQGDIFKDIEMVEYAVEKSGLLEISKILFPLVLVLSQECDLNQDHYFRWSRPRTNTQDKWLISVLVAPLYNVEHLYTGEHLSNLSMTMETINKNKTDGKRLRNNETPRYHFLSFPEFVPIVDCAVDFKHYFTVNGQYLRKIRHTNFVCRLSPLFREDVTQRFSAYLA